MAEILTALKAGNFLAEPASEEEFLAIANWEHGNLTGYDCPECLNRGFFWEMRDGMKYSRECRCMAIRRSLARIERSGLKPVLDTYTFETFQCREKWQAIAKREVMRFSGNPDGKWLLLSGQPGCGKTHLCTAAAGSLLRKGMNTRYMRWVEESARLKANVNDEAAYYRLLNPLKTCKVLYIDDFFKRKGTTDQVSQADIRLAFELIDHRYADRSLVTILSTERSPEELYDIDEATGSRIYERTRGYQLVIEKDRSKNWRIQPHESES